jgi:hypothetical protein
LPAPAAPLALKAGQFITLQPAAPANGKPVIDARPSSGFLQAVPKAFLDSLPPRAAAFAGKDLRPRRVGDLGYADLQAWINAEPALRRANLPRLRPLARDAAFRKSIQAEMRLHPEWAPVLASTP